MFCVVKFIKRWGPHFLCWISGVVQFNRWLFSNWEENKCRYKLSKCTKWHIFHSKRSKLSFWVKIIVILSVAQLGTTFNFFSAWDKSRVKWINSQNSTQKMMTEDWTNAHPLAWILVCKFFTSTQTFRGYIISWL